MNEKKQEYQKPIVEVVTFECDKIITASNYMNFDELEGE